MDLNKSREFFDPVKVNKRCHIIGCGAIGSSVAELLEIEIGRASCRERV